MRYAFPTVVLAACLAIPGVAVAKDLPRAVTDLGLTDIQIHEKPNAKYGRRVLGTLASGSRVEIDLDGDDGIEDVEARGKDLFPIAAIRSLVQIGRASCRERVL